MTVSGAVLPVGDCAVYQDADIFFIFQKIVKTVVSKGVSSLGFQPIGVQTGDNFPVAAAVGVLLENPPHNLCFLWLDGKTAVHNLVTQGGFAAGMLAVAGHEAHFLHGFLPGL